MKRSNLQKVVCLSTLSLSLGGCTSYWEGKKAHSLIEQGNVQGVTSLQDLAQKQPEKFRYDYLKQRDKTTQKLLQQAQEQRLAGHLEEATTIYNNILSYDPQSAEALRGLLLIEQNKKESYVLNSAKDAISQGKSDQAGEILEPLIRTNPSNTEARALRQSLSQNSRNLAFDPQLNASLRKPISLAFVDVDVRSLFDFLSQTSGLNFIFDREVKSDLKTTIFARDTSIEDALKLILKTSQLKMKVLNDMTLLIYSDNDDKRRQYDELIVRNFYLKNIEPKKMQEMIKALITPKFMYIDEKLKILVVRDNAEVMSVVEKLVESYDLVEPEVLLEVEVLEVSSNDMLNLGVKYPEQVTLGLNNTATGMTVNQLKKLNSNSYPLFFPDPLAILNLKQTSGKTRTLANPRIRVVNQNKAKFLIGDKIPVITTTFNQNSSTSTESISYLDVGVSLTVQPVIHINDDVSIAIDMEVSNKGEEIKSRTGLLAYQIGTRNVSTTLRLHNGETQVLAGLIKNDQSDSASHLPGLGKLPILGKLFSDETNRKSHSEIVLLITPRIIRNMTPPTLDNNVFSSGTNDSVSTKPLRLTPSADYSLTRSQIVNNANQAIVTPQPVNIIPLNSNPSLPDQSSNSPRNIPLNSQTSDSLDPSQLASPIQQVSPQGTP
ncbi:hypothetical protein [Acinetobacter dispersus]|nr:hypothetical protein [Acinetobacter dispersus]